ncbi:hypothetical protein [Catellatospora citrea]|uniref:Uncharacterized protein n=1 Tax=Catellatospora citrea TaxID=53366 RepID=A0A8J3KG27_9ACTN|nr:hypothetical protein [Catellatospora citrea]RKE10428.1 hypothetical protein C8E86_5328 [Catellatospora citrea]GIF99067.1 hypothetical protein Cci01nite_41610 [Catellatospora citrea]
MREDEDVRSALAALVADEPDLPAGSADIERRGVRRRNRRYAAIGALALTPLLAGAVAVAVWPSAPPAQVTAQASPTPEPAFDPNAGTQLAVGFPLGSAVDAVAGALPPGVGLAELPMDLGWGAGGTLVLPLASGGTLTVTVADGSCGIVTERLTPTQATAAADAVCAAWAAAGSPPVLPSDPNASERPDLAAQ